MEAQDNLLLLSSQGGALMKIECVLSNLGGVGMKSMGLGKSKAQHGARQRFPHHRSLRCAEGGGAAHPDQSPPLKDSSLRPLSTSHARFNKFLLNLLKSNQRAKNPNLPKLKLNNDGGESSHSTVGSLKQEEEAFWEPTCNAEAALDIVED